MADFNSTTSAAKERIPVQNNGMDEGISGDSLPDTDILFNNMAASLAELSFAGLDEDAALLLANSCEENIAGLCHGLKFMGKTLNTFAVNNAVTFSSESLCQAGHFMAAVGELIPALSQMQQRAEHQFVNCSEH